MHLIVPFAVTVSEAGRHALSSLALPHLERLLARRQVAATLGVDEFSLSAPHELALAAERGWPLDDGALPWGAEAAAAAGLDVAGRGWAVLTPAHLQVEADRVLLTDPDALELADDESRALLDAARPLFEEDGFALHWLAAGRWLASHPLFEDLPTASLDRVLGRNIDPWLPDQRRARGLRRLQNEVQMLWHTHPLNDAREAAGRPAVNSFWCSGSGRTEVALRGAPMDRVEVDDRLRAPALAEDWVAWRDAWTALDAGPLAALLDRPEATLTLCGERRAARYAPSGGVLRQLAARWRRVAANEALQAL
jgi:hypothetical protein